MNKLFTLLLLATLTTTIKTSAKNEDHHQKVLRIISDLQEGFPYSLSNLNSVGTLFRDAFNAVQSNKTLAAIALLEQASTHKDTRGENAARKDINTCLQLLQSPSKS